MISIRKQLANRRPGNCRHDEDMVREIKRALADGATPLEVAKTTGVSVDTVRRIRSGSIWSWVEIDGGDEAA